MAIAGIPAWRVGALALSFLCLIPGTALLWRVSYETSNNSPGMTRQGDYFVFLYLLIGALQALSTFLTAKGNGAGSALAAINVGLIFVVVLGAAPVVLAYSPGTTLGTAEALRLMGKQNNISPGDNSMFDQGMAGLILCFIGTIVGWIASLASPQPFKLRSVLIALVGAGIVTVGCIIGWSLELDLSVGGNSAIETGFRAVLFLASAIAGLIVISTAFGDRDVTLALLVFQGLVGFPFIAYIFNFNQNSLSGAQSGKQHDMVWASGILIWIGLMVNAIGTAFNLSSMGVTQG